MGPHFSIAFKMLAEAATLLTSLPPQVGYGLMAVGAVKATEHALGLARGIWKHILRPRRWLKSRYARPGVDPWAVISGAASGIGKGYALELAKDGFNIFFIDKHEEDSIATKKELQQLGVQCDYIIYDFGVLGCSSEADNLKASLDSALRGKDVAILINNVAEFQHEEFAKVSMDTIFRASNVNCHAQAILSSYFIKKLIARPVRSALVSVGTNAAEPQNPRYKFALYGATKSYNHILSSGLEECYGDKLDVMTVIPRQTITKMNPADYMFTATPEGHAKAIIDQLGWEKQTDGPLMHDLEYNMRFVYSFGLFDKFVQWCNKSRSENMIKLYEQQKKNY